MAGLILAALFILSSVVSYAQTGVLVKPASFPTSAAARAAAPVGATNATPKSTAENAAAAVPMKASPQLAPTNTNLPAGRKEAQKDAPRKSWFGGLLGTSDKEEAKAAKAQRGAEVQETGRKAPSEPRKKVHEFKDDKDLERFLSTIVSKQNVRNQMDVLAALVQEKQLEHQQFSEQLAARFHINPEGNYIYNAGDGTIVEMVPDLSATNGAPGSMASTGVIQRTVAQLPGQADRDDFMRMASARKVTRDQIVALQLIDAEKRIEMQRADEVLRRDFGITNESAYRYDAEDRAVYEVPPPERK